MSLPYPPQQITVACFCLLGLSLGQGFPIFPPPPIQPDDYEGPVYLGFGNMIFVAFQCLISMTVKQMSYTCGSF